MNYSLKDTIPGGRNSPRKRPSVTPRMSGEPNHLALCDHAYWQFRHPQIANKFASDACRIAARNSQTWAYYVKCTHYSFVPQIISVAILMDARARLLADFHRHPRRARSRDRRSDKQKIGVRDRDQCPDCASLETTVVCNSDTQVYRPRQNCAASISDMASVKSPDRQVNKSLEICREIGGSALFNRKSPRRVTFFGEKGGPAACNITLKSDTELIRQSSQPPFQ